MVISYDVYIKFEDKLLTCSVKKFSIKIELQRLKKISSIF